jgi:hypothetical protein
VIFLALADWPVFLLVLCVEVVYKTIAYPLRFSFLGYKTFALIERAKARLGLKGVKGLQTEDLLGYTEDPAIMRDASLAPNATTSAATRELQVVSQPVEDPSMRPDDAAATPSDLLPSDNHPSSASASSSAVVAVSLAPSSGDGVSAPPAISPVATRHLEALSRTIDLSVKFYVHHCVDLMCLLAVWLYIIYMRRQYSAGEMGGAAAINSNPGASFQRAQMLQSFTHDEWVQLMLHYFVALLVSSSVALVNKPLGQAIIRYTVNKVEHVSEQQQRHIRT